MTTENRLRILPRALLSALLLLGLLPLAGCGPSEGEVQQAREEIRQTLESYLPLMADAYRSGDLEPLEPYVAQKEIAILKKHINDLLKQGRVMDTHLLDLTIEDFNLPQWTNAYVTTVEYWDVKSYAAGSDRLLGEDPRQFSRVRYQLNRTRDGWIVLSRNRDPSLNP